MEVIRRSFSVIKTLRTVTKYICNRKLITQATIPMVSLIGATTIRGITRVRAQSLESNDHSEELQHDFLVRQACTVNAGSAGQLLTTLASAFNDTSRRLRETLADEIRLNKRIIEFGKNTPQEYYDTLVVVRANLNDLKHNLQVLIGYLEYAEKLATAVAEISFLSGNTVVSDMMCVQIEHVKKVFHDEAEENEKIELESQVIQKFIIENAKEAESEDSETEIDTVD